MDECSTVLEVAVYDHPQPTVKLVGESDFHSKHKISEAFNHFLDRGIADIKADLSELLYVDSSSVTELIKCAKKVQDAGGDIELVGASGHVSRVLTLCGAVAFFKTSVRDVPVGMEEHQTRSSQDFWHVSDFSFCAQPESASIARNRVAQVVKLLPLSSAEVQDLLFAVGEAITNAIKHGCKCNPEKKISVKCVAGPCRIAIDISDPGVGFNPDAVPDPSPDSLKEGGMGIYIMREIMDEVCYTFGEVTTVRMVKYLNQRVSDTADCSDGGYEASNT